jgi:hypothetical protein
MAASGKLTSFRPAFAPRALDRSRAPRVEETDTPAGDSVEHRTLEPLQASLNIRNKFHDDSSDSADEELIERERWQAPAAPAPAIKSRATVQKASAALQGSSKAVPNAISISAAKPLQPQAFLRHAVRSRDEESLFSDTTSVVSGSSERLAGISGGAAGPQGPLRKTLRDFISDDFSGQSSVKLQAAVAAARNARKESAARPNPEPVDAPDGEANDFQPRTKSSGPQLQIINGQVVMDPSSWIIGTHSQEGDNHLVHMEDLGEGMYITSTTFSKRRPTDRWTVNDTAKFYHALQEFGTDFSTISTLFAGRDRVSIRAKFNKEVKLHPKMVDAALRLALPMDLAATKEAVAARLAEEKADESQDDEDLMDPVASASEVGTADGSDAKDAPPARESASFEDAQADDSGEHVNEASLLEQVESSLPISRTEEDFDSFGPTVHAGRKRKRLAKESAPGISAGRKRNDVKSQG